MLNVIDYSPQNLKELQATLDTQKRNLSKLSRLKTVSYLCVPLFYIFNLLIIVFSVSLLSTWWWFIAILIIAVYIPAGNRAAKERTFLYRFLFEHLKYDINILRDDISDLEYRISSIESGNPIDRSRLMISTHAHSPDEDLFGIG